MAILTTDEIKEYQFIIDKTDPGKYILRDIFSSIWEELTPTVFGKDFYETYKENLFSNIKFILKKTDNHHTYEITES